MRVLRPAAESVDLVVGGERIAMTHEHRGVWVATLPGDEVPDYRLSVSYGSDSLPADDPFRFLPTLGEVDLHLIAEGRHEQLWQVLGAHTHVYDSPTARCRACPSRSGHPTPRAFGWSGTSTTGTAPAPRCGRWALGVWELFVPEIGDGTRYKYEILGRDGVRRSRPTRSRSTPRSPATASVVFTSDYAWQDADWLQRRAAADPHNGPMSIYEVHLGSWRPGLSYDELAEHLTNYVVGQGFTHVEFLPVMEHPSAAPGAIR